jgi:hypothetical protein
MAAQECDCDFLSSGDSVIEVENMAFYEETYVKEPMEKRGVDGNLWIWESPDYQKSYMVVADVARGDSTDYSGFHVFDIESCTQVAEYKGQIGTRDYGHLLVGLAAEYNDALLAIENAKYFGDEILIRGNKDNKNFNFKSMRIGKNFLLHLK